jgi:aryl-alcohol dehydrogenase-like predicted oxidoreductase
MKFNKHRKLGKYGAEVAPVGIGAMSFTNFYGPCNDVQANEVLTAALDMNLKHIDTSNVYGAGKSEERIGEFLLKQGNLKNDLFNIATKAAIFTDPETGKRGFNNEGEYLEKELDKSLKRLGVDCVDLFYVHRRDSNLEIEEVTESLSKLVEKGKTKSIGFSEIAPSSLRRASQIHHIAAIQSEYSLSTRAPEMGLVQTCKDLGTALVAFSPVGRTLLTDNPLSYDFAQSLDFTKVNPRFNQPNYDHNISISNKFRNYSRDIGVASATLSIAWLLAKDDHIIPIPGTRSVDHLEELVTATEFDMTDKIMAEIENILPLGWAYGDRYSDAQWNGPERY